MSRILCIMDGMTDPGFDVQLYPELASMRLSGRVQTVFSGQPESLTCILHLLGISDIPEHLRGYAEALGSGIPVQKDDLVLRGSFFALDEKGCCTVPAKAPEKIPPVEGLCYYPIGQYKCILICPGRAEDIGKIRTFPPCHCAGQKAASLAPQGNAALKQAFDLLLTKESCLVPWAESVPAELPPFGKRAAVVCRATIVKGIASLLQMDIIEPEGATADTDTDLSAKASAALAAAEQYEFVVLHINGADEAGHRMDAAEKTAFLRRADSLVLGRLLASGHEIIVVSDHGTDPETGRHMGVFQPVYTNRQER